MKKIIISLYLAFMQIPILAADRLLDDYVKMVSAHDDAGIVAAIGSDLSAPGYHNMAIVD